MNEQPAPADGAPIPQRDAPVGGQAVLEGVMMRGVSTWAVAVRMPAAESGTDGEIAVTTAPLVSRARRHRILRKPVIRGVVALADSLAIGFKALAISADARVADGEPEISRATWAGAIAGGLARAVGLFFVVPVTVTSLFKDELGSSVAFWLAEGVLRTALFVGYLAVVSRLPDLRRVFEYHGAEHMTIACYEAGQPLTVGHARRFPRLHPRCGTSFLLVVMLVAVFVFAPLGLPAWYLLLASRIVGIPLIAGISFEVIKWAGRHRARRTVRALMWPGMQLQRLTTRPPDDAQLAVAVAALEAVLALEDPRSAPEADRIGMEVVA